MNVCDELEGKKQSRGILRSVDWYFVTDVSGQHIGPICKCHAVQGEITQGIGLWESEAFTCSSTEWVKLVGLWMANPRPVSTYTLRWRCFMKMCDEKLFAIRLAVCVSSLCTFSDKQITLVYKWNSSSSLTCELDKFWAAESRSLFGVSPALMIFEMRRGVWLFSCENWIENFNLFPYYSRDLFL